jgi:hypothetical protein
MIRRSSLGGIGKRKSGEGILKDRGKIKTVE